MSSPLPAVGHTPRHIALLKVKLYIAEEEVEAVVDTGASASIVGKRLARILGIWKKVRTRKVRQGAGSILEGNFVVNTFF